MLKILGSPVSHAGHVSRRELLQAGGLGLFSLSMPELLRLQAVSAAEGALPGGTFGRAKRIMLLFLYGAAAQHETFDLKPDAPAEIRGLYNPIDTVVPGIQICEHLPLVASIADRLTIIRSMSHPYNIHCGGFALTGIDKTDIPLETNGHDSRHWPFFGSVLDYLAQQRDPTAPLPDLPRNMALPFRFTSRLPGGMRGGPYGGFLGRTYDPVWTDFSEEGTRKVERWNGSIDQTIADPFLGISPDAKFSVSKAAQLGPHMTLDRLNSRRDLLSQLDASHRAVEESLETRSLDRFRDMSYALMTSPKIRDALDVQKETAESRERYGMTLFGQSVLAGRRLLEAGSTLVTVVWDEYKSVNSSWDTHFRHYERLGQELLPGFDRAFSSLILDLEARGMLDDTLVMCVTEHGRTPKISNTVRGAGREHWSETYCNVLAGAGIGRGQVVGESDRDGAFVKEFPVSPKDILATMYHLMGINPHQMIPDMLGRPLPLVADGRVLPQLLA